MNGILEAPVDARRCFHRHALVSCDEDSTVVAAFGRPYRHEGVGFQPNGGMGDREPRVLQFH